MAHSIRILEPSHRRSLVMDVTLLTTSLRFRGSLVMLLLFLGSVNWNCSLTGSWTRSLVCCTDLQIGVLPLNFYARTWENVAFSLRPMAMLTLALVPQELLTLFFPSSVELFRNFIAPSLSEDLRQLDRSK